MSTVDRIAVELALRDAGFRSGLATNRGLVASVEKAFSGAARRMAQALETGLKVGGVGAAAGIGFAVKAAVDFESQVGAVRKTTGLTGQALDGFVKQVERLARTLPGVSVEDLLGAAAEGGRQGMTSSQQLLEYVQTIGMMKVALDDIPIEESSNMMGKLASNYGLGTSAVRGLASALNKLDDTTKASAREIMQAAMGSSQMAHALGISADWALALSSGLVEAGMSADTAGVAFAQIIRRLSSEQENFAALAGVSAEEYGEALQRGPLAALELVIRRLQLVAAKQGGVEAIKGMVDAKVVDQQQTQALLSLVQTWDQLGERAKLANEEMQTSASLSKEVEVAGQLAAKQFGLLWNQVVLAGKAFGSQLLPALKVLSKHFGDLLENWAAWAESGALDGLRDKLVEVADVIGAAFNDLPGTFDLISVSFDALIAHLKAEAISLFETLKQMLDEEKWNLAAGAGEMVMEVAGWVAPGLGAANAALAKNQKPGTVAAVEDKRTASERAKDEAAAKKQEARNKWEEQRRKGEEARNKPKEEKKPSEPDRPLTAEEGRNIANTVAGLAFSTVGTSPLMMAGLQGTLKDQQYELRRSDEFVGPQLPSDEWLADPIAQAKIQFDIEAEDAAKERFQKSAREQIDSFNRDEADRMEERQSRMFSVQSGGADDFASAVQAGIGKTGDIQKEIRDYNRRSVELLQQLTQQWAEAELFNPETAS